MGNPVPGAGIPAQGGRSRPQAGTPAPGAAPPPGRESRPGSFPAPGRGLSSPGRSSQRVADPLRRHVAQRHVAAPPGERPRHWDCQILCSNGALTRGKIVFVPAYLTHLIRPSLSKPHFLCKFHTDQFAAGARARRAGHFVLGPGMGVGTSPKPPLKRRHAIWYGTPARSKVELPRLRPSLEKQVGGISTQKLIGAVAPVRLVTV